MDSAFIYQAANELVKNAGTRNIKQIARSCSLDISETSRIKDMLGLLSLYFDKPLILINRQLDKQTKQMVCGYALGHYLEHQLLMDLHTLNKFLTIKDKHIICSEIFQYFRIGADHFALIHSCPPDVKSWTTFFTNYFLRFRPSSSQESEFSLIIRIFIHFHSHKAHSQGIIFVVPDEDCAYFFFPS